MMTKKEKDILKQIKDSFNFAKRIDHVSIGLSLDFLTFLRYYGFDKLTLKVAAQGMNDLISYQNLHEIFMRMGLIPFNMDMRAWAIDLNQGMNTMKVYPDINEDADMQSRVVNGWKALQSECLRVCKQAAANKHFKDVNKAPNPITIATPSGLGQPLGRRRRIRRRKL